MKRKYDIAGVRGPRFAASSRNMKRVLLVLLAYGHMFILPQSGFTQNYEIYVSDAGNFNQPPWQILKFDGNGQNPSVFINTNLNWPQDLIFLEDSNTVLVSNLGSGRITRHNATNGAFISNFASGINGPTRIKIGPDSLLYVLQWSGNGRVRRYNLAGTYLGEFTSVGVPQSIGLDWDQHKNLYVSSYSNDLVRKFDSTGADLGVFINSNLVGPTNIWFDNTGNLLVLDYDGTAVKKFDSTGTYISDFAQGLSKCEGVDFFPNGDILIGNGATSSVKMYDSTGTYLKDLVPSGSGSLLNPNAVVIRSATTTSSSSPESFKRTILYPNPAQGYFTVDINLQENWVVCVFNSFGQTILHEKLSSTTVPCSNWSPGIYMVQLSNAQGAPFQYSLVVKQ